MTNGNVMRRECITRDKGNVSVIIMNFGMRRCKGMRRKREEQRKQIGIQ